MFTPIKFPMGFGRLRTLARPLNTGLVAVINANQRQAHDTFERIGQWEHGGDGQFSVCGDRWAISAQERQAAQ